MRRAPRFLAAVAALVALVPTAPALAQAQRPAMRAPRAAGAIDEEALARFRATPPPIQSADGTLYVSCASATRATMRWPVLRFVERVRENLAETLTPLGSQEMPLLVQLGDATTRVETLERRTLRADDGLSQLVIRVPNPETVNLEALREAVAEALLRQRARDLAGSYGALRWPGWFIRAAVDASRGNVWRAEAYEQVHAALEAGTLPKPDVFFAEKVTPSREIAAFFADWVFGLADPKRREALIVAPWTRASILGNVTDKAWEDWVHGLEDAIFMPGLMTRAQFLRWATGLTEPKDAAEAQAITRRLTLQAAGRPRVLRDLTELYLRAYAAFATGDAAAYKRLRAEADEARAMIETHLKVRPVLADEPTPEATP